MWVALTDPAEVTHMPNAAPGPTMPAANGAGTPAAAMPTGRTRAQPGRPFRF
jgi:hypothetical protein